MIRLATIGVVAALTLTVGVNAAEKIGLGDKAPAFSGLEGTDGKSYSLDSFKDKDVLVVVITCNKCPAAVAVEDRLIDFTKKYQDKVAVVAINVNKAEADSLPKMKERAKEKGFNFPYAFDPTQKIALQLGARVTPEFYVFDKERKLQYHGAMDDNVMKAESVKTRYLADAVEAVLKGEKPAKPETAARGCGIGYEK